MVKFRATAPIFFRATGTAASSGGMRRAASVSIITMEEAMTADEHVVLDFRGKKDRSMTESLRELLLTRRADVSFVEALVDNEKIARKLVLFARITECRVRAEARGRSWSVTINPPSCPFRGRAE